MDKQRRKFLKIAGATALAGISAPAVVKLTSSSAVASSGSDAANVHGSSAGAHKPVSVTHGSEGSPAGVRLGLVVDMRKFYGKPELLDKAIDACVEAHNIPQIESKKSEVKWIWKAPFENVFSEHSSNYSSRIKKENDFLVLCNHCDEPPCVRVCPTQATYRLPNGIVAMDFHRCIGCRFCMMACPYGARSFNWENPRPYIKEYNPDFPSRMRGVVEKCNFCGERIALGKEPACLEAVKESGAIIFGDLNDPESEIRKILSLPLELNRQSFT